MVVAQPFFRAARDGWLSQGSRAGLKRPQRARYHIREARSTPVTDFRDAYRALRASPIVSAVAILSLALGIGANTAIFSIVNALMLRTLPVKTPERLVLVMPGPGRTSWSNPLWEQLRARDHEFLDGAFAYSTQRFNLARGGEAELVNGVFASGEFFDVLGLPAILGRTFTPADDIRG